jgi:ABC-2 type transport system permease protein
VLSVTTEWSQRSGLATFTLVPHRGRVLLAKAIGAVLVAVPATAAAFGVGALGNMAGAALADVPVVWDQSAAHVGNFALGQTLLLLVGFAWFADARPWLDAKYSQDSLLSGELAGDGWSHLAVTSLVWLVVPMVVAVVNVLRSEVK